MGELAGVSEEERKAKFPSLEELMPKVYAELNETQKILKIITKICRI
jgi:pyruvate,orthophosphate dikinase